MLLIVLLIIATIDYFWQRHTLMKQLRMSMKEMKDEMKETEGSRSQGQDQTVQMEQSQQSARQRDALENVPDATAVIVSPTHFAVALRYVAEEGGAPVILAMGKGVIAERIIERPSRIRLPCSGMSYWPGRYTSPVILVQKSVISFIMRWPWYWPISTGLIAAKSCLNLMFPSHKTCSMMSLVS